MTTALESPLISFHVEHNASIVDFAGWMMPLHYGSITHEYAMVRDHAGLFDVSHMGRFDLMGDDVISEFQKMTTRRLEGRSYGRVVYTLIVNEAGKILDDILVYLRGDTYISLVVNASNRSKLFSWFQNYLPSHIKLVDRTFETAMVALQGPFALEMASQLLDSNPNDLPFYRFNPSLSEPVLVSRTGYTGEDGVEVAGDFDSISQFCRKAIKLGAIPAGLGARDILRMEMGYPLYGHELDEETSPYDAGLEWAVDLDNREFIGANALRLERESSKGTFNTGLLMQGKGIPRQGFSVRSDGQDIGVVTSGGFSPLLKRGIALVRLPSSPSENSTPTIVIRDREQEAEWKTPPFVPDRTARKKVVPNE